MASSSVPRPTWACKPCNREFPTWELLWAHKRQMRSTNKPRHDSCVFCGQVFRSEAAELQHVQRHHPTEQKLHCPGCGLAPFARVGSLISHIESGECRITTRDLDVMREKKLSFQRRLEEITQEPVKMNFADYVTPDTGASWLGKTEPPPTESVWSDADFPQLHSEENNGSDTNESKKITNSASDVPFQGAWGTADVKSAWGSTNTPIQPTADELEAATAPGPRMAYDQMDIDDPDHPSFNAARYYCKILEKYNCPKIGCGKSFKKTQWLINHLNSPAHGSTTYRCPGCNRLFKSLTAITSHAESASTRCRISASKAYPAFMDQLTAGIVQVNTNVHGDGTQSYSVSGGALNSWKERDGAK